uniref:Uncharacterized protein n=1 Tax=Myotis myotis TaxID=51298 RepID=A0A7J7Z508_MYOMY|nr:hypothetical protein mMyoMyo1_010668 [Myotis myotis]
MGEGGVQGGAMATWATQIPTAGCGPSPLSLLVSLYGGGRGCRGTGGGAVAFLLHCHRDTYSHLCLCFIHTFIQVSTEWLLPVWMGGCSGSVCFLESQSQALLSSDKTICKALAGLAQWIERWPAH